MKPRSRVWSWEMLIILVLGVALYPMARFRAPWMFIVWSIAGMAGGLGIILLDRRRRKTADAENAPPSSA